MFYTVKSTSQKETGEDMTIFQQKVFEASVFSKDILSMFSKDLS